MCFVGVSFLCCSFSDFQLQRFTTWKKAAKGGLSTEDTWFQNRHGKNRNTGNFCAKSLTILTKHSQFFENLSKKHVDFTEKLTEKFSLRIWISVTWCFHRICVQILRRNSQTERKDSSGVCTKRLSKKVLEALLHWNTSFSRKKSHILASQGLYKLHM